MECSRWQAGGTRKPHVSRAFRVESRTEPSALLRKFDDGGSLSRPTSVRLGLPLGVGRVGTRRFDDRIRLRTLLLSTGAQSSSSAISIAT